MSDSLHPAPIRLLLVDDHKIMRDGLRLMLCRQPDLEIVGEAEDRQGALACAETLLPDIIILDIGLPDADGVDVAREILARWPRTRIIILSGVGDQEHLEHAMEAGVTGYLLKTNASEDLVRAVRTVYNGGTYLCPEVSAILLTGYKRLREARTLEAPAALTDRENQVLKLVAEGRNTKEIAAELGLSGKTVETHRARLMAKLGIHSVAELTKHALRMGLTSL